ncbi:hypothetical protein [Desulfomonile tiedjei]|uniref:Uncharacterized protein n=1 Tax=Desulfomonile tiedjei (strain ATCC 49306 / DSM 6799 / DCB-1) TaxID=706587 RepID=I4C3Y0_DESTA|nr:hypothetical protein [Desulfomonile tiedjei]AFM24271.1 hypothetical protein Desti_1560 [Desulfomonile tiedjei DSM 6799]
MKRNRAKVLLIVLAATLLLAAFPATTQSNYEMDNCIMQCRVAYDPVLNPGAYASCVSDCKTRYEGRPQL